MDYQTTHVVFNLQNGYSAILEVVVEPLEENCKYILSIIKEYNINTAVKILEGYCSNPYAGSIEETVYEVLQNESQQLKNSVFGASICHTFIAENSAVIIILFLA